MLKSKKKQAKKQRINAKNLILTGAALLFIVSIIIITFLPSFTSPGIPSGVDTPSFLHTAKIMVDHFVKHGSFPQTDPKWYSGLEYLHYAPPLIYVPIGLAYFATDNIRIAGKIFQVVATILAAFAMFWVVRRKHGLFSATIAGALFPTAPWVFFQLGSPTKLTALIFMPICFYFTEKLLEEKKNSNMIVLAGFFVLALLSHPMMGVIFMAGMTIFSFVYAGFDKKIHINRAFFVLASAVAGMMLGGYWVIPFYFEKAGWSTIPLQELVNYSHPFRTLFLFTGIPLVALGLYSVIKHRDPKRFALLVIGIMGGFLALGVYASGFVYVMLPFLKTTYPGLWLNLPVFAFVYLAATAVDFEKIKGSAATLIKASISVLIVGIVLLAAIPVDNFTWLTTVKSQLPDKVISAKLKSLKGDGRVAPMKYPFGHLVYELGQRTSKNIMEGHYFGISRIGKYLAWNYDALDHGYTKYPLNILAHHNIRYLIANGNLWKTREGQGLEFGKRLIEDGFIKISTVDGYYGKIYDLYEKKKKSSYLVPVTEKTLVVGKYAYTAAVLFSEQQKVLMGGAEFIDDYDDEALSHFRTLVIYGLAYRSREKAEQLVRNYVSRGGNVVVDLYGSKLYGTEANASFLGVSSYLRTKKKSFDIKILSEKADDYFAYKRFDLPYELSESGQKKAQLEEWRYVTYLGLDEPIAHLKKPDEQGINTIAGFKNVKGGKVMFIGPNYFYHTYLTHNDEQISKMIKAFTGKDKENNSLVNLSPIYGGGEPKMLSQSIKPNKLQFKYTSERLFPALVSYAWSRHWKAFVDGKEIKISNMEDLMFVTLPKGSHTLTIEYGETNVHHFARGLTFMTLLFFGWLIFRDRRKKMQLRKAENA